MTELEGDDWQTIKFCVCGNALIPGRGKPKKYCSKRCNNIAQPKRNEYMKMYMAKKRLRERAAKLGFDLIMR